MTGVRRSVNRREGHACRGAGAGLLTSRPPAVGSRKRVRDSSRATLVHDVPARSIADSEHYVARSATIRLAVRPFAIAAVPFLYSPSVAARGARGRLTVGVLLQCFPLTIRAHRKPSWSRRSPAPSSPVISIHVHTHSFAIGPARGAGFGCFRRVGAAVGPPVSLNTFFPARPGAADAGHAALPGVLTGCRIFHPLCARLSARSGLPSATVGATRSVTRGEDSCGHQQAPAENPRPCSTIELFVNPLRSHDNAPFQ